MNRGVYVVSEKISAVTAAKTLIQLKAGTASAIEILRAWVTQSNVTADDNMEIAILRKSAAATVTSFTPKLLNPADAAAKAVGGTAATGTNATVEGTDGDVMDEQGVSVLAGYLWLPTPEERVIVPQGGIIALKSMIAITSADLVCGVRFREIG